MSRLSKSSSNIHVTKNEFVYNALREAIMNCELQPGERLIIQDVADRFGLSIIPVREALRLLNFEDLVVHKPHVGSIVAPISKESIIETFTLKESLEGVATRIAVGRFDSEHLNKLEKIVSEMDAVLQNQTYEMWGSHNTQFHATFTEVTEMPMLIEISNRVLDKWNRIRRYYFKQVLVHRLIESQEEHHLILKAAQQRDAERAELLVKQHNRNALAAYMEYLSEQTI